MSRDFKLIGRTPRLEDQRIAAVLAHDASGRVLMQLRDTAEDLPASGQWSLFGGGVEEGEDLLSTACREFHEETGITLMRAELMPLARFSSEHTANTVIYVFRTTRIIEPHEVRLGEGAGFAFLTREQIDQYQIIPNVREMLEKTLPHR